MTPRELDAMSEAERLAFQRYMERDLRAQRRAATKRSRS